MDLLHDSKIYAVNIKDISINECQSLFIHISDKKVESIKRMYFQVDKIRLFLSEVLIRTLICNKLNITNKDVEFCISKNGKPFLKNNNDFHFNISHSGDWVFCIIGSSEVGIDIEYISDIDVFSIADNYFTSKEKLYIYSKKEEINKRFFEIWSVKESVIKADGRGLSIPLSSFYVNIQGENISLESNNNFDSFFSKLYYIDDYHSLAATSLKNNLPVDIEIINFKNLIENFREQLLIETN